MSRHPSKTPLTVNPSSPQYASEYTLREEVFNSITHGIGFLLSIVGLILLVIYSTLNGTVWHIVSCSIYGTTLILLYLASTLYHAIPSPRAKRFFKVADHAAIYLLIAGSYTPFTLVNLHGAWGWSIFGVVWGIAVIGVVMTLFFAGRFGSLFLLLYLAMGWVAIIAIKPLFASLNLAGAIWLVAGGLTYTLGVIFYLWKKLPYHHGIWHLFVLGGSVCHYITVMFYTIPPTINPIMR